MTQMYRMADSSESYMYRVASGDVSEMTSIGHRSGVTSLGDRQMTDLEKMRRETLISN